MGETTGLNFFVNGEEINLIDPNPELTLAYYIRNTLKLTGTKLGCEEGACGACTVVVGKIDPNTKKVRYEAINSCLVPIFMVDHCSIITVEGISKDRIHPVQERLSRGHGTQCGFCSPGFTMAMYALLRNNPEPTMDEISQAIKGNLCRCTGYRPILEAFYSFSGEAKAGCCGGGGGGCPCKEQENINPNQAGKLADFGLMTKYDASQEIIFPPKLLVNDWRADRNLALRGGRVTLHAPNSLNEVAKIASNLPDFKIISSGMISRLVLGMTPNVARVNWLSIHRIAEMEKVDVLEDRIIIGGALSIGQLEKAIRENVAAPDDMLRIFRKYSAEQVKNTASWTGALCSASPTSDFCALALAVNCKIKSSRLVAGLNQKSELLKVVSEKIFDRPVSELADTFDEWGYGLGSTLNPEVPDADFKIAMVKSFLRDMASRLSKTDQYHNLAIKADDFEFLQLYQKVTDSDFDACGRPLAHQFAGRHTTGEAKYVNDLKLDGLLHGAPVLSKEAHAEIISVDPSEALKLPGVLAYIDEKDIPAGGSNTPLSGQLCLMNDNTRLFAAGKVESVGQMIGLIVANDVLTARRAAKLVNVEYSKLKSILDVEDGFQANELLGPAMHFGKEEDAVAADLAACEFQISGKVGLGGQEHIYMETQSCVAVPGEENEFILYTASQGAAFAQLSAAQLLGIPSNNFTVKIRRVGGAFGGKAGAQCGFARWPALLAAHKLKRPVSMVLHRQDDVMMTGKRHPAKCSYKVGFSSSGKIEAIHYETLVDGGWSIDNSIWVTKVIGCLAPRASKFQSSNTAFRGYGQPQAYFIMDAIVNHVAQSLGKSFEEVKELNFAHVGDLDPLGAKVRNDGMLECWEECKKMAEFTKLEKDVEEFNRNSPIIKRGVAMGTTRFGMPHPGPLEAASALVQICYDGAVSISIGGVEMGQGLNVKIQQCASRALGIPIDRINLLEVGTDKTTNAPVTGGSQGADIHGKAVKACCDKLIVGLKPFLEKAEGDWNTACFQAYLNKTPLQASEFITIERDQHGLGKDDPCYYTSGAICTLVELDTSNGEHRLVAVDIVMDVGESLNPAIDIGQIEGGFMQGYGLMTCEDLAYDQNGKLLTDTAYKYKIPTVQMVPDRFRVKLLEGISCYPEQIYRSKGIGEPPLMLATAVHAALLKAIIAKKKPEKPLVLDAPLTAKKLFEAVNRL
ncbi:unnamed protein product, partial [Mesorhabditis spiculigera]